MKVFFASVLGLALGATISMAIFLAMAKKSSIYWQDEIRGEIIYKLQSSGLNSAKEKDWSTTEHTFQIVTLLEKQTKPREWDFFLPLHAWSMSSLVEHNDNPFSINDESILAYSLNMQGRHEEADVIYKDLDNSYPGHSRLYFENVAKGALSVSP